MKGPFADKLEPPTSIYGWAGPPALAGSRIASAPAKCDEGVLYPITSPAGCDGKGRDSCLGHSVILLPIILADLGWGREGDPGGL